jgi:probable rRNA maturation factor
MGTGIFNEQTAVPVDGTMEALIRAAVKRTLDTAGFAHAVTLDIFLTDDDGIQEHNRAHRGINAPTDVLSFPLLEYERPLKPIYSEADSDGAGGLLLGDIVISLERVREQAAQYGHGFDRELGFMVVHGVLHLLGYDHVTGEGEAEMIALQESVLTALALVR